MTLDPKALEAARQAVDAAYLELGFQLKDSPSRRVASLAVEAYLAALDGGSVVVPREPTEAMEEAGDAWMNWSAHKVWSAMIAAAAKEGHQRSALIADEEKTA